MTTVLSNNFESYDKPKLKPKYSYEKVNTNLKVLNLKQI